MRHILEILEKQQRMMLRYDGEFQRRSYTEKRWNDSLQHTHTHTVKDMTPGSAARMKERCHLIPANPFLPASYGGETKKIGVRVGR